MLFMLLLFDIAVYLVEVHYNTIIFVIIFHLKSDSTLKYILVVKIFYYSDLNFNSLN